MRRWKAVIVCVAAGSMAFPQSTAWAQTDNEKDKPVSFYTLRADELGEAGKYQEEIDICNEGLKLFPGNPDLRELTAEALGGLGRYKEAENLFRELINSNDPKDQAIIVWVLDGYQKMLIRQNRMDEAARIGQEEIEASKHDPTQNQAKN